MSDNTEAEEMTKQTSQSHVDVDRNNMDDRGDGDNDVAPPAGYNSKDILQSTDTILEEQPSSSTPSTAANVDCAADNVEGESFANENIDGQKTITTEATTTEVEQDDNNEGNVEEIEYDDPHVLPPTQDIEKGTYPTIIPPVDDGNDGVQQGAIMRQALGVSGVDTVGSDSAPSTQPGAVWMFPRGSSPGEGDVIDAAISDPLPILEATRVPDEEENQSPVVYNAVQVERKPWYKQKGVYVALGSALIGAALAIGFTQGRGTNNNNNNELVTTDEESDTELITVPSSSPSQSLSPTSSPSQSLSPTSTLHFKPYGSAVNGKAEMDLLGGGISLSTDGALQAVSAGQLAGTGPGYVEAYMWDEDILDYKQFGTTLFGESPGDAFGYSLSASDNLESPYVLAIGSPFALEKTGMAKVYRYDEIDSAFVQMGDTLYGTNPGDIFGELVDISADGSVLAIGSSGSDEGVENAGSVYIYKWDEVESSYSLQTSLNGEEVDDEFGFAFSLSSDGNTVAVGSPKKNSNTGQVKVFTWDEDISDYLERDTLSSGLETDEFGWSVSLNEDGSVLAVGSLQIDIDSPSDKDVPKSGLVKVYQWNGELSEYTQRGSTLKGDNNGDDFGTSIALSDNGETLIVGAPMNDKGEVIADYGQAKVFIWDASALDYVQLGESLYGESPTNYFGGPVAISGDGRIISIGAVGNSNNGPFSGQVTTFVVPTVDDSNSIN